jgi:hypothetical protein
MYSAVILQTGETFHIEKPTALLSFSNVNGRGEKNKCKNWEKK